MDVMISKNNKFAGLMIALAISYDIANAMQTTQQESQKQQKIIDHLASPADLELYDLVSEFGQNWAEIAKQMHNYSEDKLQNRWLTILYFSGQLPENQSFSFTQHLDYYNYNDEKTSESEYYDQLSGIHKQNEQYMQSIRNTLTRREASECFGNFDFERTTEIPPFRHY